MQLALKYNHNYLTFPPRSPKLAASIVILKVNENCNINPMQWHHRLHKQQLHKRNTRRNSENSYEAFQWLYGNLLSQNCLWKKKKKKKYELIIQKQWPYYIIGWKQISCTMLYIFLLKLMWELCFQPNVIELERSKEFKNDTKSVLDQFLIAKQNYKCTS